MPTGIDPSLLTSAAFELVQASQALQAVQAVQPLLHAESPPMMTPLTQVYNYIKYVLYVNHLLFPGPLLAVLHGPGPDSSRRAALSHPTRLSPPGERVGAPGRRPSLSGDRTKQD